MLNIFWQFPHFWAIAWFSFDDYKRAGYNLLPSGAEQGFTNLHCVIYLLYDYRWCFTCLGITGPNAEYQGAVLVAVLGAWVLVNAFKLFKSGEDRIARKLMLSSIGYLTGMQLIYVIDRFI